MVHSQMENDQKIKNRIIIKSHNRTDARKMVQIYTNWSNKIIVDFHSYLLIYMQITLLLSHLITEIILLYVWYWLNSCAIKWQSWHIHKHTYTYYVLNDHQQKSIANLHTLFFFLSFFFYLPLFIIRMLNDLIGANTNTSLLSIWEPHTSLDDNRNTSSTTKTM